MRGHHAIVLGFALILPAAAGAVPSGAQPSGALPPDGVLAPLTSALDDAQSHAASLAEHAATAAPATLTIATPDEDGAFSALVAADTALARITRDSPASLQRQTDTTVLTELNAAHRALARYARARIEGDRQTMRASAKDAVEHLGLADAALAPEQPLGGMSPR